MTQGVADLLRRAAGHRRSGDPPTYQRQYLAHAPGSAVPQFSGLSGVAGIAIDLVADVTGTLALDALARRAENMKAEAGPQGVSAGLEAAFAGQPMPRATNEMSAGARAYDNGAATGYAAALANRAKAGLSEIAIRNEANPDGFAQEAETFRREFDFVPRQLSPDFDLIWREAHEPLRLNLEKGRADRAAEVNGLELRTLLDDTNREISVVARGGDLGRARELTQRHEATLAAAVADGSLSAVQADEFRRRRDGTLREHSVMGRFDDAIADGIGPAKAYRDWFGANFGEMGLSADERDELDARMAALINHAEAEADRSQRLAEAAAREAQTRLGHDVESLVRVGAITGELPAGWGAAKAAADKIAPELAAGMRRFEDGMTWRDRYRKLPPDEQRAEIERLDAA
ncbi:MAG TPA: hypothetical protein VES39_07095, partial [Rhodospirillales bacterium]|nr:hypothetical protein [Rhodospirillales bacterium]